MVFKEGVVLDCEMLFPFELVKHGSKVLIYGAGLLGQSYLKQVKLTNYCDIVGFIDREYEKYHNSIIPVYPVREVNNLFFDYIVVALRTKHFYDDVYYTLNSEYGIEKNKIVAVFLRDNIEIDYYLKPCQNQINNYAYNKSRNNIAVFISGGLGDCIIQKSFINALVQQNKSCLIDFYSMKAKSFLPYIYSSEDTYINNFIYDSGTNYTKNKKEYNLAISLRGTFVKIDNYNREVFYKVDIDFSKKLDSLVDKVDSEVLDRSLPAIVGFMRRIFLKKNCYSSFDYEDVFHIDRNVNIYIPKGRKNVLRNEIGNQLYITINTANGDTQNNMLIAKTWPLDYYESLVGNIKSKYKNINIVQVGSSNAMKIKNVDYYILGRDLNDVKVVLKESLLHIDIEGGLVHLASQLGTKCAVLFGPTLPSYYGYKENINIAAGNCHGCYGLFQEINRCARDMQEPECMYSITPEIVMRCIEEYLDDRTE